jgi:hypothetical protein
MRRIRAGCLVTAMIAAALWFIATPATAAADCIGVPAGAPVSYPEQRQFVENQAWWMPGAGQPDNSATHHGHTHMGTCIPERETISSGNLTFHVRVMMHDNPGKFNYVSMVFKGTDYETTVQKCYVRASMTDFTCPGPNSSTGKGDLTCAQPGTCERWLTFSWPISAFGHSGLQEVRFRGFVPFSANSTEMRTNLNFQVYIQNGKSVSNVTRQPYLRSKGWYTHALYCESDVRSVPLPDAAVSGTWTPTVGQVTHSSDASLPVTHSFQSIDPDFHAVPPNPGTVLRDSAGGFGPAGVPINTTTLTNGTHKLYLKADCRDDSLLSTNSGVLVVPFQVAN